MVSVRVIFANYYDANIDNDDSIQVQLERGWMVFISVLQGQFYVTRSHERMRNNVQHWFCPVVASRGGICMAHNAMSNNCFSVSML